MTENEHGYWVIENRDSGNTISMHSSRLDALTEAFDIVHNPDTEVSFGFFSEAEVLASPTDSPNVVIRFEPEGDTDEC